ncbi:extracellular solute-binding protein [Phyllobacterium myrsinacearum]|uniref:extracellular solute-binding protein n=1 Tax=Phyllobacterium myrsinacearum TaxID=28101 RepID=UPI000D8223C8|nr:extracellular solute-binding protein [Phyllobacterium myrsinacearum]PWV91893.1 carbohydrate ABC transporter substrate-binding protein (CUT1 family) [Phyllobacterium myrsinacearum]RZV05960.1 carbohydrate ABC transporter substrate-binding protein (CUT1 family) [Phyllobacterium myrsinacearum]
MTMQHSSSGHSKDTDDIKSAQRADYTALTWQHPRGYEPLAAAARAFESAHGHRLIEWQAQRLEGFEEHPIADLAARYDLIVLDHPHIGEAVATDCLSPLEKYFTDVEIAAWRTGCVGGSLDSYQWADKHWALPIDVAAQVSAYRPDLLESPPKDWYDVLLHAERIPVALSIAGPHAFLSFLSICVALGEEPRPDELLFSDDVAIEALDIMARLSARAPHLTHKLNPIDLLESMAQGEQIALVPLVFGYVNYAQAKSGQKRVAFTDAPTGSGTRHGSVLGGTGIAISSRTDASPQLIDHLRWLMSDMVQTRFFTANLGQPSARAAWTDRDVNEQWGDFYAATLTTIETALVRPRYDGYIAFQTKASDLVRSTLVAGNTPSETLTQIRQAWQVSRNRARTTFI